MRTETIEIYQFEELSKDVQEKVIEANYDWNTKYEDFSFEIEIWEEKLNNIGFTDSKISFSGFSSPGSGASFISSVDIDKIFSYAVYNESDRYSDIKDFEKFINLMDKNTIKFSFWVERVGHYRYSHENTCAVDYELDLYLDNCSLTTEDWFYATVKKIRCTIEDIRYRLSKEIYSNLQARYEYLQSEEAVKESLIANEMEFLKNGTFY